MVRHEYRERRITRHTISVHPSITIGEKTLDQKLHQMFWSWEQAESVILT